MPTSECEATTASCKERFDLLYGRLKSAHDMYIDVIFKATAAFLLVTGWMVTSESALGHLRRDPVARWLAIVGLTTYALLFLLASLRTTRNSMAVASTLRDLNYAQPALYSDVVISGPLAYCSAGANALLCIVVGVFVSRVGG
jgi:hypothetical protein